MDRPNPEIEALRRDVERLTLLASSERGLLDAILHHSPHGIIVCDAHGKLTLQNRASETIWAGSASANDVEGWGQYRAFHPDGRPYGPGDWSMARALRDKTVTLEETHIQRFDGRHAFLLGSSAPILDAAGNVTGGLSVFADITELKNAERKADEALRIAQKAIRTREDLLAVVSHDLRNPLNVVVMKTELMLKSVALMTDGAHLRKDLETIRRAAERMQQLVGDLLDLGSIEAGTFTVREQPHPVEPLLQNVLEHLQPLAAAKSLRLQSTLTASGDVVACDRDRVAQIFSNLVGNAIKFTPEGGEIRISATPLAREVQFSVADNGPGIPPEQVSRLFDRYWQSPGNDGSRREGVGLGLFIAKGIVDAHKGRLWVDTTVGTGSTFHFTLPRVL